MRLRLPEQPRQRKLQRFILLAQRFWGALATMTLSQGGCSDLMIREPPVLRRQFGVAAKAPTTLAMNKLNTGLLGVIA